MHHQEKSLELVLLPRAEYSLLENFKEEKMIVIETDESLKLRDLKAFKARNQYKNLKRFRDKILWNLEQKNVVLKSPFWTLTSTEEHWFTKFDVRTFFTYLRNTFKKEDPDLIFSYIWSIEYGEKNGMKHLHFLTSKGYIDYNWLKKRWGKGNPWFEKMDNVEDIAKYVVKYTTKAKENPNFKPLVCNERSVGCSRDFKKPDEISKWSYISTLKGHEIDNFLYDYNNYYENINITLLEEGRKV